MNERWTRQVDDPSQALREALRSDPVRTAYLLGDLDPTYAPYTRWFASGFYGVPDAVLLVYTGLSVPAFLTWGQAAGVDAILEAFIDELPERTMAHIEPAHLTDVDRRYDVERLRPMLRMGLRKDDFATFPHYAQEPQPLVEPLGHRDTGAIMELYQHYPDSFFEPTQLSTGHYYGIRVGGRLTSVAGLHVYSPFERVAALGNVVTHPDSRGQGLSTACTAHLCAALLSEGIELLALNVERDNRSAIRVYEKLGFRSHNSYLEGLVERTLDYKVGR